MEYWSAHHERTPSSQSSPKELSEAPQSGGSHLLGHHHVLTHQSHPELESIYIGSGSGDGATGPNLHPLRVASPYGTPSPLYSPAFSASPHSPALQQHQGGAQHPNHHHHLHQHARAPVSPQFASSTATQYHQNSRNKSQLYHTMPVSAFAQSPQQQQQQHHYSSHSPSVPSPREQQPSPVYHGGNGGRKGHGSSPRGYATMPAPMAPVPVNVPSRNRYMTDPNERRPSPRHQNGQHLGDGSGHHHHHRHHHQQQLHHQQHHHHHHHSHRQQQPQHTHHLHPNHAHHHHGRRPTNLSIPVAPPPIDIVPENSEEVGALSVEIAKFYSSCVLGGDEKRMRRHLVKKLEQIVRRVFGDARLRVHGSCATGFAMVNSDIDVDIVWYKGDKNKKGGSSSSSSSESVVLEPAAHHSYSAFQVLSALVEPLTEDGSFEVVPILYTKVPIIKITDKKSNTQIDLAHINKRHDQHALLLNDYAKCDRRAVPLVLAVKSWAKKRGICNVHAGSLSSYAYTLMVIQFLQTTEPQIVPNFQNSEDKRRFQMMKASQAQARAQTTSDVDVSPSGSQDQRPSLSRPSSLPRHASLSPSASPVPVSPVLSSTSSACNRIVDQSWDEVQDHDDLSLGQLLLGFLRLFENDGYFDPSQLCVSIRMGRFVHRGDSAVHLLFKKGGSPPALAIEDPFSLRNNVAHHIQPEMMSLIQGEFSRALYILENGGTFADICAGKESRTGASPSPSSASSSASSPRPTSVANTSGDRTPKSPQQVAEKTDLTASGAVSGEFVKMDSPLTAIENTNSAPPPTTRGFNYHGRIIKRHPKAYLLDGRMDLLRKKSPRTHRPLNAHPLHPPTEVHVLGRHKRQPSGS